MATVTLYNKYRPQSFDDLTEQSSIKLILEQQLSTGTTKNCYLFVGGAGTGKTTSARILANKMNGKDNTYIEIDAAGNNGKEDVEKIKANAQSSSVLGKYKIYILDEVHMFSNAAWNAMLKLLEEPPKDTIFVMCTTDPQKIPATIMSRVQRYDFQRISFEGIVTRLKYILEQENGVAIFERGGNYVEGQDYFEASEEALEYIAKLADGGMRDAIGLLEKCLSYSKKLTIKEVTEALGTVDYNDMFLLTDALIDRQQGTVIETIEGIHRRGINLIQFIKQYSFFLTDLLKYSKCQSYKYISIPCTYSIDYSEKDYEYIQPLQDLVINIYKEIKFENSPRMMIEAMLLTY